jgi:hypothetical protein
MRERALCFFPTHLHAAPCKRDIYLKKPEPAVHSLGRLYRSPAPAVLLLVAAAKNTIWKIRLSNAHTSRIPAAAAAVGAVKCVMAAEREKITFRPAARAHIKFADREIKWEAFSGRQ